MCRFILYNGPAIQMSKICLEPEHGMLQQSLKAFCHVTPLNADGFGVSWYTPGLPMPGLFKDLSPAWSSPNLKQMTRSIQSPLFFAHVRAASTGGVNYPNSHPFVYKNLSFMHNGTAVYFKHYRRQMLERFVSDRAYHMIEGTTDSEMMFAMFVTNFEKLIGVDSKDATHEKEGEGVNNPFSYIKEGKEETNSIALALKMTLRQVHSLILEHEYKTGIQSPPTFEDLPSSHSLNSRADDASRTNAILNAHLPQTKGIGRLNLAISDGVSSCVARYITSAPETAHTLYYATGEAFEVEQKKCKLAKGAEQVDANERKMARCTVVSSEPLSTSYECESVPVNHMIVNGPNSYFSIEEC